MRAFYYNDLPEHGSEILLEGETFQHLKVVRLRPNEEFLLLNGKGGCARAHLLSLEKKQARVQCQKSEYVARPESFDVAIGLVKKDAFDLCLKMAVELGIKKIIPLESEFSQRYDLNLERADRLMIQALEQSNSLWLPELVAPTPIDKLDFTNYHHVIVMGVGQGLVPTQLPLLSGSSLALVGPEGGFGATEEQALMKVAGAIGLHLPCPILRTPTALAALAGVIFTKQ